MHGTVMMLDCGQVCLGVWRHGWCGWLAGHVLMPDLVVVPSVYDGNKAHMIWNQHKHVVCMCLRMEANALLWLWRVNTISLALEDCQVKQGKGGRQPVNQG